MKEEAAVEPKDFLYVNDHDIREQLWWFWQHHQWLFDSAIAYLSFVKADSAVKCEIFSLHWSQSVPWWMNHLTDILQVYVSDLLNTDDHQSFYGERWMTFYLRDSTIHWLNDHFMETVETFVTDNTQRACNPLKTFYGEGGKPFTCVTVPLTEWAILFMKCNPSVKKNPIIYMGI